jgi:hypothetical protein
MSYDPKHLSAALEWIERNHPNGVALVARALSETPAPRPSGESPDAGACERTCVCGHAEGAHVVLHGLAGARYPSCLILGGPTGGCGCTRFVPAPPASPSLEIPALPYPPPPLPYPPPPEAPADRVLARNQPCGCIVCTCNGEDEPDRCFGCGAKSCGTHPVGEIPDPVYAPAPPPESGRAPDLAKIEGLVDRFAAAQRGPAKMRPALGTRAALLAAVRALAEERDRREAVIRDAFRGQMASVERTRPLCPGHRDKQSGRACLACQIETLTRRAEAAESALSSARGAETRLSGEVAELIRERDQALRRGTDAAARVLAGQGIDCRGLLDLSRETVDEIAGVLPALAGARRLPECRSVTVCCYCGLDAAGPTEVIEHVAVCAKSPWPTRLSSARRDAIEDCVREVNALKQRNALAGDRAKAAGRDGVAMCRQSDVETCEEVERRLRSLAASLRAEPGPTLRPEVLAFARVMSAKIDGHNHDRGEYGWRTATPAQLMTWLERYVTALSYALDASTMDEVLGKAANVANLAMMIADVCGGLAAPLPTSGGRPPCAPGCVESGPHIACVVPGDRETTPAPSPTVGSADPANPAAKEG